MVLISISYTSIKNELWGIARKGSKISGILFLFLGLLVSGVSAYVYQQASLTVTQNIVEVASFTVKNSDLGNINEGQTLSYTRAELANLGEAITITTTTAPVYLHFDSDVDSLSGSYTTYDINVIYDTVPSGGTGSGTACTLSLGSPDYSSLNLDVAGTWVFDLSITTTADSVSTDTPTSVSLTVGADST
jgi:hypothetical protein